MAIKSIIWLYVITYMALVLLFDIFSILEWNLCVTGSLPRCRQFNTNAGNPLQFIRYGILSGITTSRQMIGLARFQLAAEANF